MPSSTENNHIDKVWNPWKSGAGHTLHQNHQSCARSPDPVNFLFPAWQRDIQVRISAPGNAFSIPG